MRHHKWYIYSHNLLTAALSNRKRLSLTIFSVALSSILFLFSSVMINSYTASFYREAKACSREDVVISGALSAQMISALQVEYGQYVQTQYSAACTSSSAEFLLNDLIISVIPNVTGTSAEPFSGAVPSSQSSGLLYESCIVEGRDIEAEDLEKKSRVTVISESAQEILFAGESAIGKTLELSLNGMDTEGEAFTVIGVYADAYDENAAEEQIRRALRRGAQDVNMQINCYVPITLFEGDAAASVVVHTGSDAETKNAIAAYFSTADGVEVNYYEAMIVSVSELNQQMFFLSGSLMIIMMVIAGGNLFNSMMFALRSRISEVGIRKAMGADAADILVQFMLEGVFSALAGALIGACIVTAGAVALQIYFYNYSTMEIYLVLTPYMLLEMLLYVTAMSLIAGFMPALKASGISIVEAIRFD